MAKPLVVVPSRPDDAACSIVEHELAGLADVAFLPRDGAERERLLASAEALLVFAWRVRAEELGLLDRLRFVQSVWAGADRIPTAGLLGHRPGVVVATGSGPNAPQVAEHAVGLYLDCAKRITWRDRELRAGRWRQAVPGRRVAGSRVAVVGFGAIGRRVGRALASLEVAVTAVNRRGRLERDENGAQRAVTLEGLRAELDRHDGVVLALPLTEATRGIVDRAWLAAMPADGILVNVARGALVVAEDLLAHLQGNAEFQAGLDVWWHYPRGGSEETPAPSRPLLELPNVVATPHSAFHVPGAREEMIAASARNVARFLTGAAVRNVVAGDARR